jgi:uncharacterized protein YecT (DUF1311 family)
MGSEARSRRAVLGRRAGLGLALLAALARPAAGRAQEFHENVPHPCQDYWMVRRAEILACLRADLAAADAELNRTYRERMAALSPAQRTALREAQRAWLRRYDATLTAYYSRPWANHSLVRVLPSQIRALRDRAGWIRRYRP